MRTGGIVETSPFIGHDSYRRKPGRRNQEGVPRRLLDTRPSVHPRSPTLDGAGVCPSTALTMPRNMPANTTWCNGYRLYQ